MESRSWHGAGIITDVVTDEQLVVVTGGWSCDVLTSTEILQDGEWVQGKINDTICHLLKTCWLHNSFLLITIMY